MTEIGPNLRVEAVHLATSVWTGAGAFVASNRRAFKPGRIDEIDAVFPQEL